jgi:ribose transport system substrate-binding protein
MRSTPRFRLYGLAVGTLAVASLAVVAVVGTSTASVGSHARKSSCVPPVPKDLPKDPNKVLSGLNRLARTALGGYAGTIYKSPWAGFKPKHGPPWKIGFSNNQVSLYGGGVFSGITQEKAANSGKVSKIISLVPSKPNDVGTQIQQMRSLLQQKVDIIFSLLSSPTALNGVIDQAAKQGVPVISIAGRSTSKNAINLQPNTALLGYYGAAGLVNAMGSGGGGDVLMVRAIPGLTYDEDVFNAGMSVLKACNVNIVGTVQGFFDPSTAKTAVLQFLASHPGKIDGVFQISGMAPGIISAFDQVGRPVPPVADINPGAPSLVYWQQHKGTYHGSGVAIVPQRTGQYVMALGLALLGGRGVKVTEVPFIGPVITSGNLGSWVDPSWTSSTAAQANGPANSLPIKAYVDAYTVKKG